MRKRHFYKVLSIIIAIVLFSTTVVSNPLIVKADSAVNFHNGMLVLTPEGANGTKPDFFKKYTSNLLPGDSAKFAIQLKNDSSDKVKFYFWAADTDFENNDKAKLISDELVSKINLKIELIDSNGIIYDGPASGKGNGITDSIIGTGSGDGISLGWLDSNTSMSMYITINVPTSLGNEYQGAVGAVDWVFLCEILEVPTNPPTPTYPPTEPTTPPTNPTNPTTPPTEPTIKLTEPVTPTNPVSTPTVTPSTVVPTPVISTIPDDDTEIVDIPDDDVPLDLEDDTTPSGVIVVDDRDLGKLPQTGTFASVVGNTKNIGWFVLLLLSVCCTLSLIKNKRKNTSN
jgi:hypothetical protein